jgi:hypothetical protein
MLQVDTALGFGFNYGVGLTIDSMPNASYRHPPKGYNSVTGNVRFYPEHVIYEADQTYIRNVIFYKYNLAAHAPLYQQLKIHNTQLNLQQNQLHKMKQHRTTTLIVVNNTIITVPVSTAADSQSATSSSSSSTSSSASTTLSAASLSATSSSSSSTSSTVKLPKLHTPQQEPVSNPILRRSSRNLKKKST